MNKLSKKSRLRKTLCILSVGCIFFSIPVWSQNTPIQFWFDDVRVELNPAIPDPEYLTHDAHYTHYFESIFSQELLNLTAGHSSYQGLVHYQWFPEYRADHTFRWNFGGSVFVDKFGATEILQMNIRTGLNWISPDGDIIAAGVRVGYQHQKIDLSATEMLQFGDPLALSTYYEKAPDVGFGLFASKRVQNYHDVFFGISVPHIYSLNSRRPQKDYVFDNSISFLAGANIYYSDYGYFEPLIYYRSSGESIVNLRLHFRKAFWLAAGYDSRNLTNIEFGLRYRNLKSDLILSKSELSYWRLAITYRYWNGTTSSVLGNRLGFRLAYIW